MLSLLQEKKHHKIKRQINWEKCSCITGKLLIIKKKSTKNPKCCVCEQCSIYTVLQDNFSLIKLNIIQEFDNVKYMWGC